MNSTLTSLIEPLGWALLHFLWQATVIALLLRGYLWLTRHRSPQTRYAAAGVAMLLMLGAAITTVWWQARGLTGQRTERTAGAERTLAMGTAPVVPKPLTSLESLPSFESSSEAPAPAVSSAPPSPSSARETPNAVARLRPLLPWMVGIWAAGVAFFSLRLLNSWRVTNRWRASGSDAIPGDWQELFSRLCQRLRLSRPVRLLSSASLAVPVVIGWLKPVVLVPAGLFSGLGSAQLEALLAHELAHVRRHDYFVNLLQNMLETLFFYHPAVWWVSGQLRKEREHCCDDVATSLSGGVLDYARALTALEEMRGVPGVLSISAAGGSLLQRIRRLAGITEDRPSGVAWPLGVVTFAAAAVALPFTLLTAAERSSFTAPQAAHVGNEKHSAYCVHDGKETHFVLVSAISFTSETTSGANPRLRTWHDDGTLKFDNGGKLTFSRESASPDTLNLISPGKDGRLIATAYDLAKGRVFLIDDNPVPKQLTRQTPLVTTREALETLYHDIAADAQAPASSAPVVRGLKLAGIAVTTDTVHIADLYEPDPQRAGMFTQKFGVFEMPIYGAEGEPWLKYPAGRGAFYIEFKDKTCGPIPGDPMEKLKLTELLREKLREDHANDAMLRLRKMIYRGDDALRSTAYSLMQELAEPKWRFDYDELIKETQEALKKAPAAPSASKGAAALAHVSSLADNARAKWEKSRVTVPDSEYQPGENAGNDPGTIWNKQDATGMSLGYSVLAPGATWKPGDQIEFTLWIRNDRKEPVKFSWTPRLDEGLRMWATDEEAQRHEVEIVMNTTHLVPIRSRLEPGQKLELKKAGLLIVRATDDGQRPARTDGDGWMPRLVLKPGKYQFQIEVRIGSFESSDGQGNVTVPAAGEWTGKLFGKPLGVEVSAGTVSANTLDKPEELKLWDAAPKPRAPIASHADRWLNAAPISPPPPVPSIVQTTGLSAFVDGQVVKYGDALSHLNPRHSPKHEETNALLKLWKEEYRNPAMLPAEAMLRLAAKVKEYIERYPGEPAEKLKRQLLELDLNEPWQWSSAQAMLDAVCDCATAPVGWLELDEQFRNFDRVKPGQMRWTPEQLAKLPFGETDASGLRAAWIFAPMQDTYATGSVLKCRIIFHNNGKEPVAFRTDQWHQDDRWHVKNAAGAEVKVKTRWYTGVTPWQKFKLEPGQACEVAAHGVGIGEGKYEESYSTGAIGAEIPAKPGDELTCQWIVKLDPSWRQDPNWTPPPGSPPPSLTTGKVTFKVAAADPNAAAKVGIARSTGKYELADGIKLQVTQVTSGKDGEPTSRINTATIEWYAGNGQLGLTWPIELMPGLKIDPVIWKRGGTAMWIVHEKAVRKIDFTNASDVKETVFKGTDSGDFGGAPPEVRAEIEKLRPKIAQVPLPSSILQFRLVASQEGPDTEPMEAVENWSDLPTFHLRKTVILTAADVESASAESDKEPGRWQIKLVFTEAGGAALAKATKENPGRQLAIVGNGKVISAPVIQGEMGKQVVLSGNYLGSEAKELVEAIQEAASARGAAIEPADRKAGELAVPGGLSTVDLLFDGSFIFDGAACDEEAFKTKLAAIAQDDPKRILELRAGVQVEFKWVQRVLELAHESGLEQIRLSTTQEADAKRNAPASKAMLNRAEARRLLDTSRLLQDNLPDEARKALEQIPILLGKPEDSGFYPEDCFVLAEAQFELGRLDAHLAGTQPPVNAEERRTRAQFLDSAVKRHTNGLLLLIGYDKDHPKSVTGRPLMAQGYMELGQFFARKGDARDASVAFRESIKLYVELIKEHPDDAGRNSGLALVYNEAAALIRSGKPGKEGALEALDYQNQSVELMRTLHAKHPKNSDPGLRLAAFLLHNGELREEAGDAVVAHDRFKEALTIATALLDGTSLNDGERNVVQSLSDQAKAKVAPDAPPKGTRPPGAIKQNRVATASGEPVNPPKPVTIQQADPFAVPGDPEKFAEARRKGIMVNVLDTTGRKPIPEFRVIAGVKSGAGGGDGKNVANWQPHTLHTGTRGALIWPLDKAYDEMALRVEADGYEPQVFAWIKKSEGAKDLYFQLVESKGTSGRALMPDGNPAAGATVALAMVQRDAVMEKGKLRHLDEPAPEKPSDQWRRPRFVKADAAGRFQLPPEYDPTAAVLIVHDSGVREMPLADFKKSPDVTLQTWGRIEGRVLWGDKAGGDQAVSLSIHRDSYGYPGVIAQYEKTKAAADGSFVFERVLPGRAQLSCPIAAEAGNQPGITEVNLTGQIAHITVQPGVTPAVIGGAGRTVKGKLTGRDSWDGVTFHFHPAAPHVGFPGDDEMWKAWSELQKSPSGPLLFRNGLPVNADGTFEIPNVLPAEYQIFFSRKGEEGHIASGKFSVEAETPGQKTEALTLPEMKAR